MTSTQQPVASTPMTQDEAAIDWLGTYQYGWADTDVAGGLGHPAA